MKQLITLVICLLLQITTVYSHSHRADSHAPIGVMGDHMHKKGEWMLGYRYMWMNMNEIYKTDSAVQTGEILADYMMSPTRMQMAMQMWGVMYAPNDTVTLTAMVPHLRKNMEMKHRNGTEMSRESNGMGDMKVNVLTKLPSKGNAHFHSIVGLSFPTGSIDKKDGQATRLGYSMQLGSGTTDVTLGLVYRYFADKWSAGIQPKYTTRLGENKHNYTLGNHFALTTWFAKPLFNKSSASLRLSFTETSNIIGADSDLNPNMMPGARTDLGGRSVTLGIGYNTFIYKEHRLAAELILPIQSEVNNIKMATNSVAVLGWQYAF